MSSLAVFDFDRTVSDEDSDASVIELLSSRGTPPEWESGNYDWTPYMDDIFGLVHAAGFTKEDILTRIGRMRPVPGVRQLITTLADNNWDVVLITDSNSVFVHHWLKTHELEDKVSCVITNPARWDSDGRLHVEPHSHQLSCPRCPANLCKSQALAQWRQRQLYRRVAYVGDGRNDFCPMASLGPQDTVFPRAGYPCEKMVAESRANAALPDVEARVVPWTDAYSILGELFPHNAARIA